MRRDGKVRGYIHIRVVVDQKTVGTYVKVSNQATNQSKTSAVGSRSKPSKVRSKGRRPDKLVRDDILSRSEHDEDEIDEREEEEEEEESCIYEASKCTKPELSDFISVVS